MTGSSTVSRGLRHIALGLTFALVLVACGQKPGVRVDGGGTGGLAQGPTTGGTGEVGTDGTTTDGTTGETGTDGTTTDGTGEGGTTDGSSTGEGSTTGGDTTSGTTTGGDTTSGTTTSGDTTSGTTSSGTTSSGTTTGGGTGVKGSDRTGAEEDVIRIGIHAPVTGAAPLPSSSFEKASIYFDYVTGYTGPGSNAAAPSANAAPILGRNRVEVIFKDDKYKPSSAVQACREMAQGNKSFLLVGGGGTDQIQACGQYANQNKIPYFSAGVTEVGLQGLPYYFGASMTYKQQGLLLAQYIKKTFPGKKVKMLVTDTPNFDDAIQGFEAGVQKVGGIDYAGVKKHPRNNTTWYDQFALDLQQEGVQVIYILSAPTDYIQFAKRADGQQYQPQFVGVGLTMGLNTVATAVCPAADGATFFSPFPGIDKIDSLDPDFKKAGGGTDDILIALWGLSKTLHEAFKAYGAKFGNDLTREDFRDVVENLTIKTNVYGDVKFSPQNHFGGTSVHVLKAKCGAAGGVYDTIATFATGF